MAYFANKSESGILDKQCEECELKEHPCPILMTHILYNYSQLDDKTGTAEKIMNELVTHDGGCEMFTMLREIRAQKKDHQRKKIMEIGLRHGINQRIGVKSNES